MTFYNESPPPYSDVDYVASTIAPKTEDAPAHRILHVYHQGLTLRDGHILDANKRTELYTIKVNHGQWFTSTPRTMTIATSTDTTIGTVCFDTKSSNIDLTVHNQPISLVRSGSLLSGGHDFRSQATGSSYKWQLDGKANIGDMVCLNEGNQLVARFYINNTAVKKEGKFELGPRVTGVLMDEIVVSGLAIAELQRNKAG